MFGSVDKVSYFRRQTKVWLVFVLIFGAIWLMLWFKSDDETHHALKQRQAQEQIVKMPAKIDKLTELFKEVAPVKFETITRDLRSYPPEFQDKKYFEKNSKKWAVQVMDVAEHKVILNYLATRPDREKFAYFRYLDANKQTRYILTYGLLSSFQEAMGATKLVDFRLPNNVRVVPEEIRRYVDMIDRYERSTLTESKTATREIKLSPTNYEIPVAPRQADSTPVTPKKSSDKSGDAVVKTRAAPAPLVSHSQPKPVTKKVENSQPNGEQKNSETPKKRKKTQAVELEKFEERKRAQAEAAARAKADETPAVAVGD